MSLFDAARTGNVDVIKSAIEAGSVHVNAIDKVSTCHIINSDLVNMNYSK